MTEQQALHRQEMEKAVVFSNIRRAAWGQAIAGGLSVLVMALGTWLIYMGRDVQGFVLVVGQLGTLAGLFLYGKRRQSKELADKRDDTPANR